MLPDALLDSYVGDYGPPGQWNTAKIRRLPDGLLSLNLGSAELVMHAESPTKFYALTTDVLCTFEFTGATKKIAVSVGDDETKPMRMDRTTP